MINSPTAQFRFPFLAIIGLLLLLSGCIGSRPSQPIAFLVLTPDPEKQNFSDADASPPLPVSTILIRRISIPTYLDRSEVTYFGTDGTIKTFPRYRWSEPLEKGISRSLRQHLLKYQSVGRVDTSEQRRASSGQDYRIWIDILELRPRADASLELTFFVEIEESATSLHEHFSRTKSYPNSWDPSRPQSILIALDQALQDLASALLPEHYFP
ncbi:MAG: membrane integrity-associated transporter subunit PqiC [Puniceicoccaceae bacterium]